MGKSKSKPNEISPHAHWDAKIKKTVISISEAVEKNSHILLCKMVQSLWETVWVLFKKFSTELPKYPEILRELKTCPHETMS